MSDVVNKSETGQTGVEETKNKQTHQTVVEDNDNPELAKATDKNEAKLPPVAAEDRDAVHQQLGRLPRGAFTVAHRCSCGLPDVVQTPPLLEDGTPFPTTFYVTCPRAASKIGTLESSGMMREMTERLAADPELAQAYQEAHVDYLRRRAELGQAPQLEGISAGGMPERVKCLHVLLGHSLAAGPGVNPLGDEVVAALGDYGASGPCTGCGEDPQ